MFSIHSFLSPTMSVDLLQTFEFILDVNHPPTQRLLIQLRELKPTPMDRRSTAVQLQYTKLWCVLAKLLHTNRHKVMKVPSGHDLSFEVSFNDCVPFVTSNYWHEVFFNLLELLRKLVVSVTGDLKLASFVKQNCMIRLDEKERVEWKIVVHQMLEGMAMTVYCMKVLVTDLCKFNEQVPIVHTMLSLRLEWMKIVVLWMLACLGDYTTGEGRSNSLVLFSGCCLAFAATTSFSGDVLLQLMAKNARTQAYLSAVAVFIVDNQDETKGFNILKAIVREGYVVQDRDLQFLSLVDVNSESATHSMSREDGTLPKSFTDIHSDTDNCFEHINKEFVDGVCYQLENVGKPGYQFVKLSPCLVRRPLPCVAVALKELPPPAPVLGPDTPSGSGDESPESSFKL